MKLYKKIKGYLPLYFFVVCLFNHKVEYVKHTEELVKEVRKALENLGQEGQEREARRGRHFFNVFLYHCSDLR